MRYKGKTYSGPNVEVLVLPRKDEDFVIKARAVLDVSEFDKLVPPLKPPMIQRPGKRPEPDFTDKDYRLANAGRDLKFADYFTLKSLEATEDLEWDTVDMGNPDTWGNWKKELEQAGFAPREIIRIIELVNSVNALDDKKFEEAKARFLATQGVMYEE